MPRSRHKSLLPPHELSEPQWDALAQRYRLGEQAEWRKLLTHFDLTSGFDFVVLLVSDDDGALLCRHELEKRFAESGHTLRVLDVHTPADLLRLPEWFLYAPCPHGTACLWLQGVAPDYTKDYAEWRSAWQHALARLNTFRNPIRDKFNCTLLFAGAPWLQEVLRETAPDLWSVRTTVVTIATAPQHKELAGIAEGESSASANLTIVASEGPDPYFALQHAEKLRAVPGKELELANLLHRAGEGFEAQDNWREAEKNYAEALELQQRHNAPPAELLATLNDLAWACLITGQPRRTIELSEQALAIARKIGDRRGEGNALNTLGIAYAHLGQTIRAIRYGQQSIEIAREIGDRRGEGKALMSLGNACADAGETRRAIEYYEQTLMIDREIGDQRGEGNALGNLGNAYSKLGQTRRALEYYEKALIVIREIGNQHGEGTALGNLGMAYAALGETRRAIEYYEQALVIAREIGDQLGEAQNLLAMSLALDDLGERARAVELATAALAIFEQIEHPKAAKVWAKLAQWRGDGADGAAVL